MTRGPVVPWRRLVALLVLACIGFSAVEVVWAAETVGVAAVGAATDSALPAGDPQDGPTETHPEEDCRCLCECACANTQQATPAIVPIATSIGPAGARRAVVSRRRAPPSVSSKPHLRPPIQ